MINLLNRFLIKGDSGYGQQPWLNVPLTTVNSEQGERYNKTHKKIRSTVERCIGILKSRFRCLCRQRLLMYNPARAGTIINACAVLHNLLLEAKYPDPTEDEIQQNILDENLDVHGNYIIINNDIDEREDHQMTTNAIRTAGIACRSRLIREHF